MCATLTTLNCSESANSKISEWGLWVLWWGRWDLNPGSPTPQAGILNQYRRHRPSTLYSQLQTESEPLAIRRPQQNFKYKDEILKTIAKAKTEGKADNTLRSFYFRLKQLSKFSDLMKPEDVKQAIAYAKLTNSSKVSFTLAYDWFCKTHGL